MMASWISPLPPADRVAYSIAHTPHFAWAFRFLNAFPSASLALVGGSVRDAIVGSIPNVGHLLITNAPLVKTQAWIHASPAPAYFHITLSAKPLAHFLASRTFTANALAYDIGKGEFHDPYAGIDALRSGLLTTVSDPAVHFQRSPHEAFRALRLSAQLGVSPSPAVWRAAVTYAPHANRLTTDDAGFAEYRTPRKHLVREALLALRHGMYGWELFSRARATPFAFPHLDAAAAHDQAALYMNSVHDAEVRARYSEMPASHNLIAAALFNHHADRANHYAAHAERMQHDAVAHPQLSFSSPAVSQILQKTHALLTENPSLWPLSRTEKILLGEHGNEALSLAHIATLHDSTLRDQASHIARAALTRDHLVRDVRPQPLLRGRDLLPLGLSSGPHLRIYLNRIRDEQLKGDLQTREDALAFVHGLLK